MQRRKMALWTGLALLITTLLSCALHKPSRVLVPQMFGMTCPTETLCVDDLTRLDEARQLRREAVVFVEAKFQPFRKSPRVLFCTTEACYRQFGNPQTRAQNMTTIGAVINHTGWQDYVVRHELIHHLQNEEFGIVQASYRLPRWFIEGMAYALSEDPRRPLPRTDIEGYRDRFNTWIAAKNTWRTLPSE